MVGNPAVAAATSPNGVFIINSTAGVPAGVPFVVKVSDPNRSQSSLHDAYSAFLSYTADLTGRQFTLWSDTDLTTGGFVSVRDNTKGMIRSQVTGASGSGVAGAVVSVASWKHPDTDAPYTVRYDDGYGNPSPAATSTPDNGRFFVMDIDDGDVVTVKAVKDGLAFAPLGFPVQAGAVSQGTVSGDLMPIVTLSPVPGTYTAPQNVTLTPSSPATVYCTTDGRDPVFYGAVCPAAISVAADTTIRYVVRNAAGLTGSAGTAVYQIGAAAPIATSVRIASTTPNPSVYGQPVTLTAGATPPPTPIPVDTYIGPGQNVATLTIGPPDSVLTQGGTLQFRLTAKDAQGVDVPTFYASWTTSDTNVAKVSTTGVLTAPLSRATVNVVARTPNTQSQPNGVTASTSITFAPVATVLAIVSGCGQNGLLDTQLPLPIVAKVTAGDGLGVRGVVVTFAPPAGGAVTTPQVVTDANGLAQTLVTLPSTSGPAAFQVSAPGLTAQQCAQSAFGAAAKLAFVTQPSPTLAGSVIAPAVVVAAQDAQGTLVPTFTGNVTIALGNNPGNGTLSGTAAVAAVGGLATFSNLSIDKAGVGYTLVASAPSLTGATSAAFNIGGGTATRLLFTVQPAPVASGVAITPAVVVTALDALGNVAPTFAAGVTVSIDSGPAGAVLTGTSPVTAVGGLATFADLKLDKVGSYHLRAHATGLTDAVSALEADTRTHTLYAGTNAGIYKSTDGGDHWVKLGSQVTALTTPGNGTYTGDAFAGRSISSIVESPSGKKAILVLIASDS